MNGPHNRDPQQKPNNPTERKETMGTLLKTILDGINIIRAQLRMLKEKHRNLCIVIETYKAEANVAASDEAKKAKEEDARIKSDEEALCQAERLSLREKLANERDRFRKEANRAIDASSDVDELHAIYDALHSLSLPQKRALHKARWVAARASATDLCLAHKLAKKAHRKTKRTA